MQTFKKLPWGTIAAIGTILVLLLTGGIIGCWYVLNAIAAQTHNSVTIFDTWWQILMFVADLVLIPTTILSYALFFKFRKEKQLYNMKKPWKTLKVFSKSLYSICTGLFGIFFIAFTVGQTMTVNNSSFINEFLGVEEYEIVQSDDGEIFNEYTSDYMNDDGTFNDKAMRNNSLQIATQVATEGTVLLKNEDSALPLAKDSKISFFGISSSKYIFSGAGSGQLAVSVTTNLSEACKANGLSVNPKLTNAYKMLSGKYGHYTTNLGMTLAGTAIGDHCYVEYGINEAPWSELNKTSIGNVTSSFAEYGDAAVMIISRNDGEDGDTNYKTHECVDGNYLDLAYEEMTILDELMALKEQGTFKKVILVINAASPMQMKHISQYDLDACVWVGIGGNVSFEQIAQVLSGKANPSGRLIDTYAYDNYSAPSSVNMGDFTFATTAGLPATEKYTHNDKYIVYSEGIYVGYRYYETRYEDVVLGRANAGDYNYSETVAYPFGYGTSYTTFEQSGFKVKEVRGGYEVSVMVENTGNVPGKDVVQVYLQKPYTAYDIEKGIEKAAVELVGYAKTKTLKAGEKQELTIFVEKESFKSYDAYGYETYIVEAGDYYLSVGLNSHDALNNILAAKGKTVADGMDYNGDASYAEEIVIDKTDAETYSKSTETGYEITNQFNEADPTLYEGTKEQFANFKYLTRNDWTGTYPTPAVMDCVTQTMVDDLQYAQPVEADPNAVMPTFGKSGSVKLIDLWGRDFDDEMWEDLLDQITWEEAVTLVTTGGGTAGCVSAGAPGGLGKDGPGGINVANENLPNLMCFPSECVMAATFNDELIEALGNAFGMEILHVGYTCIYAPGANIHRSAFSGRNWEYYSEDPFISGKMLASEVRGLQNRGVIVNTKHFLLNDQERNRYGVSVWANEQSIREIYLAAFEGGVRDGNMNGIMSSFNRIGAIWSGKHAGLLTEVLRNEWGFVGVVQTDAYVSTHMHRALAESVVAGNDYTMGGANPTALDAYKNNATVAQALRDCCHRLLYTQLHSNAMNGLSMDYKIVYHTPWWQTALEMGRSIAGILTAISAVMLLVSIVVTYAIKKKNKLQRVRGDSVKAKYFFDVFPKSVTAVTAIFLVLVIVAGIMAPTILEFLKPEEVIPPHTCQNVCVVCGGCTDLYCEEDACKTKCSCPVLCEHACNTCGLCLDATSTDDLCKEKCGSTLTNLQEFEAEDDHVLKYAGNSGDLFNAKETGATESYVGGLNANGGASLKFVLEAEEESVTNLIVSISKRQSALLFMNSMLVTVNGNIMESKAILPAITETEADWVTFMDLNLGCIQLKEGRNVIEFTVTDSQNGTGFNFNAITLKSNTNVIWYEGEHICDDICTVCGLCRKAQCGDFICEDKCLCDMNKQQFNIVDGEAELSGLNNVEGVAEFNAPNQKVTYAIKSTKLTTATLFLYIKTENKNLRLNTLFSAKINGKEIDSSFNKVPDGDYTMMKFANVTLPYGHNTIEIVSLSDNNISFKGIVIGCDEEMTYVDENEFLTTEDYVFVTGAAYKSTENCIAMNENAQGSIITFPIKASEATTADLYFNIATRSTPANISDILKIKVNGEEITTEATLPNVGMEWFTYNEVFLNNISLKAGHNEITFEVLTNNPSINTNLRAILFKNTTATLEWSDAGATSNRVKIEAENTTFTKVNYEGREYPSVNGGFEASGDVYVGGINDAGLYVPGEAKLSFKVNATEKCEARIYFGAGVSGSARASSYTVFVNGVEYNSTQNWSGDGWYDWKSQFFGVIQLQEGLNTIEIRINSNECINLDYFIVESAAEISEVA